MSLTYYCMLKYDIRDMEINKCACNMILEMNKCIYQKTETDGVKWLEDQ